MTLPPTMVPTIYARLPCLPPASADFETVIKELRRCDTNRDRSIIDQTATHESSRSPCEFTETKSQHGRQACQRAGNPGRGIHIMFRRQNSTLQGQHFQMLQPRFKRQDSTVSFAAKRQILTKAESCNDCRVRLTKNAYMRRTNSVLGRSQDNLCRGLPLERIMEAKI